MSAARATFNLACPAELTIGTLRCVFAHHVIAKIHIFADFGNRAEYALPIRRRA